MTPSLVLSIATLTSFNYIVYMETLLSLGHYFFSFVIVISVIVFIHEFGHYIVAKWCGVKISAFSIGFGKEIFGWYDKSGTRWKVCALPFGGYVKMYGDATAASTADKDAMEEMSAEEKAVTFHHKKLWQKAAIVSAGPIANFLLTIVLLTYIIVTVGMSSTEPVIGEIMPDTPAAAAQLQPGDRIVSVDGEEMDQFNDIVLALSTNLEEPVSLVIERAGERQTLMLTPQMIEDEDGLGNKIQRPIIGIRSTEIKLEDVGFGVAIWEATKKTYSICETTLRAVGQIVTGDRKISELKSPIGIAKLSGQATEKGVNMTIWLMAMLSANLGLINLFPIPVLDGGHLLYYAAEAARGRPLAERIQEWGYRTGFAAILALMAVTVYHDIVNIFFS